MGVTYSLHLIEPAKFTRVVDELKSHPFATIADVESYIGSHQLAAGYEPQTLIADFDELLGTNDASTEASMYAELLLAVVTDTEWYLDKSLNYYALELPLKTFPALKPLQFLVSFSGWYSEPPEELFSESGLYGLWSADYLGTAIAPIDHFCTEAAAIDYAARLQWSFMDRLLGRHRRSHKALEAWIDGWTFWEDIRSAIKVTVDRGWALGFAMCP